jgi:hypothetical protein
VQNVSLPEELQKILDQKIGMAHRQRHASSCSTGDRAGHSEVAEGGGGGGSGICG